MSGKIVITGATGFLGENIMKRLKKNANVYAFFDKNKHSLFNVESLQDLVSSADIVLHLAGANRDSNAETIKRVNSDGTKGLLEAIEKYNPSATIIFSSSVQAGSDDIYGQSKQYAEDIIQQHTEKYHSSAVILRFTNLYGPGALPMKNSAVNTFVYQAVHGMPITIHGDGEQLRDYLFIDDAVDAIVKVLDRNAFGYEKFCVQTNTLTSLNTILALIKKHWNSEINVSYVPGNRIQINSTKNDMSSLLPHWQSRISLDEGIQKIIDYEINKRMI